MQKIKSFCMNHDLLKPGLYIASIDNEIITYDLRMKEPNRGEYLQMDGVHTFEHLLATYLRNSEIANQIVYVGPMGCRTGFYVLCRSQVAFADMLKHLQKAMNFIASFEGDIPGAQSTKECGNVADHNLSLAKEYGAKYGEILMCWNVEKMDYEK